MLQIYSVSEINDRNMFYAQQQVCVNMSLEAVCELRII